MVLAQVLSPECLLPLVPVSKNVLVWRQAQSHKLEQVVQELTCRSSPDYLEPLRHRLGS